MSKTPQSKSFPTITQILEATDKKILSWYSKYGSPITEEDTVAMKLIIDRKNQIKRDAGQTANP